MDIPAGYVLTCPACGSTDVIETDWEHADGPEKGPLIPMFEECRTCGAHWPAGHQVVHSKTV